MVRFRQLHALHDQLRRELPPSALPPFPPKKLLPLTTPQVEERRAQLERYLQRLSQDPRVCNGVTFNGFLLAAQMETRAEVAAAADDAVVGIDVFLMNDQKVTVRGKTILQTDEVLERACRQLGVPDEHVYHFALFLIQRRKDGGVGASEHQEEHFSVVRKLQDFESPYISQKQATSSLKLVLRKASWDPQIDEELISANQATLNLLYVQTLAEVERGWVKADAETKRLLARMQARGAKKEVMKEIICTQDTGLNFVFKFLSVHGNCHHAAYVWLPVLPALRLRLPHVQHAGSDLYREEGASHEDQDDVGRGERRELQGDQDALLAHHDCQRRPRQRLHHQHQ